MDPRSIIQQILQYKLTGYLDIGRSRQPWEDGLETEQAVIVCLEVDDDDDDDDVK
jgi:hypothetical protein